MVSGNKKNTANGATPADYYTSPRLFPQPVVDRKINLIIAFAVFAVTIAIYIMTQARSLSFWDCGEYITCSSILGVPHPPGNPFYIMLGRFFAIIGGGIPHSMVINFLSGLMSALAVFFLYLFTVKLVSMFEDNAILVYVAGIFAAAMTAFSYTFWNNAIEAEVYSGLSLIINLVMWLTMVWVERSRNFSHQNLLLLIIYIFFLGFGIHQTSLQIAPAVLFVAVYPIMRHNIRSSEFWTRTVIYLVGMVVIYVMFNILGESARVPSLGKWMFALTAIGLLWFHLRDKVTINAWALAILFILVGLSSHVFLLVRSSLRPFINEGYPHNMHLFMDYILRRQYGVTSFLERRASLFYQLDYHFLRYFSWQFFRADILAQWVGGGQSLFQVLSNLVVALLGFFGLYHHARRNKHSFAYFFSFYFMSSIAMIIVMNLSDAEVRDREYFFSNAYYLWTIWMAIGCIGAVRFFWDRVKPLAYILLAITILLPIGNLTTQYFIHDRHKDVIALDYGVNFLNSLEENAIVFTNGDNDTFPLWYAQAVHDPYAEEHIYPAKDVYPTEETKEMIAQAMEYKKKECGGIRLDVSVANLSLLNTPWYIRQLRDKEGIKFDLPDTLITPAEYKTPLYPVQIPRSGRIKLESPNPKDTFFIELEEGTVLYSNELAALQIIRDNYGKRPIYIAVTVPDTRDTDIVPKLGLKYFRRNEGMIDRLVPYPQEDNVDMERLLNNIEGIYQYRGIFDSTMYKDPNTIRLLGNYGASYIMRASRHYLERGDMNKAIEYMEKGTAFVKDNKGVQRSLNTLYQKRDEILAGIETREMQLDTTTDTLTKDQKADIYAELAELYFQNGSRDKAIEVMRKVIDMQPGNFINYAALADYLLEEKQTEEAITLLKRAIEIDPLNPRLTQEVIRPLLMAEKYEEGLDLLNIIEKYQGKEAIEPVREFLQAEMNK